MMDSNQINPDWAEVTSYKRVGYRGHFINTNCILTQGHILTNRSIYFLVNIESGNSVTIVQEVLLLDAYCNNGVVYLFVNDIETNSVLILNVPLIEVNKECTYLICDRESYNRLKDLIDIRRYCDINGSCKD